MGNKVKICKIDKMAKNHFLMSKKGSRGFYIEVFGVVWIGILIRAPEVPFLVPPKRPKRPIFAVLGVQKMALSETTFRDPNHRKTPN